MKKNKKSLQDNDESTSRLSIPQQALANLAEKLKVDLAKTTQSQSPTKVFSDKKRSKKKEKLDSQQAVQQNGSRQLKKDESDMKPKRNGKSKYNKRNTEKEHFGNKKSDPGKLANSVAKAPHNPAQRPQAKNDKSSKSRPSIPDRITKNAKEKAPAESSLLQEILALGGTKEDLELVHDIDSEEEILELQQESAREGGKKAEEKIVWIPYFSC